MSDNIKTPVAATHGVDPYVAPTGLRANSHTHDWAAIVAHIQAGQEAGILELYSVLNRGIRHYLTRQLGSQDAEDRLHETLLIVISAIRDGKVREPQRIMGFVRTVAQRQVMAHIEGAVRRRHAEGELAPECEVMDQQWSPEETAIIHQRAELLTCVLQQMSTNQREILQRFYLGEESPQEICQKMSLTATQFRLAKSRAKAAFSKSCLSYQRPAYDRLRSERRTSTA
jgi:RNA polymerase sigma factor (sigma-70 family)